jgi:hypothetical protein
VANLNELRGFGYRLTPGFSCRRVGLKVFVLSPNGDMHILENASAVALWDILWQRKFVTVVDLTSALISQFVVEERSARSDVEEFLKILEKLAVVERATERSD